MSDQEPYTRVPNALFDAMAELGNAELRVLLAIVRKTAGYQKACDVISVSQLAGMTGLTTRNAQTAVTGLLAHGLISREPAGKQRYCYRLTISPRDTVENHIPTDTISPRDMEPYPVGTRLEVKPYPLGTTQKKDLKEKRKHVADDAQSAPPPPTKKIRTRKPKAEPDSPAPVRQALAEVCAIEYGRHGPKEPKIQVNTVAGKLWKAAQEKGASEAQVIEGIKTTDAYCRRAVYPYKDGQPLTPGAIHKHWKAAIEERDKARARGNGVYVNGQPNGTHAPLDTRTPQERAAAVAILAQQIEQQHGGGGR